MKTIPDIFAYPTESFYGLGVRATDRNAIRALFLLKKREAGKPVALIAANLAQVKKFFTLSKTELALAKRYWPGPLTILLKPKKTIHAHTLGASHIGVRVPAHAGARRLAELAAAPVTATSANVSGHPPTKSFRRVKRDFPGILIASGRCGRQRRPSTVVEIVSGRLVIHRQGSVHV